MRCLILCQFFLGLGQLLWESNLICFIARRKVDAVKIANLLRVFLNQPLFVFVG